MENSGFNKIARYSNEIAKVLCIIFFSLLVIDVIASVFMRYVLVKPMVFGEQLADYFMIWLAFISSSIAMRIGAHMGLDIIQKKLSKNKSKILQFISILLVIIFLLIVIIWGFKHSYNVRLQKSPVVFNISMMIPYLAIPIGGIFMLIQAINLLIYGPEIE